MTAAAIQNAAPLPSTHRVGPLVLHVLAIVAFLLVIPVISLRAEVTSKGSGELEANGLGYTIEHAHRQAGWLLGMATIAIAVVAAVTRTPGWLKVLTLGTLLVVILQGVLGIFRVQLNAILGPSLAHIHGTFATVAVGLLLTQAVVTSRSWTLTVPNERKLVVLRRWAIATTGAALV